MFVWSDHISAALGSTINSLKMIISRCNSHNSSVDVLRYFIKYIKINTLKELFQLCPNMFIYMECFQPCDPKKCMIDIDD